MGSRHEIVEKTPPREIEDKIYVAVGKDWKESESTLLWAIRSRSSEGKQICILHVHQPAEKIPFMGTKFRINQVGTHLVAEHHEKEKKDMVELLKKYKQICQEEGVCVKLHDVDNISIEEGIVKFISVNNVKRLVMGAAADKHYLKERRVDGISVSRSAPLLLQNTNSNSNSGPSSRRTKSVTGGEITRLPLNSPTQDYRRVMSDNRGKKILPNFNVELISSSGLSGGSECSGVSQRSPSTGSRLSTYSSEAMNEGSEIEVGYAEVAEFKQDICRISPPSVLERGVYDELYDQLVQAMAEANNSQRDAFEESIRRRKAEQDAIEAKRRIKASEALYANELKASEALYANELKLRRKIEESLQKTKQEHENIKKELNEVSQELQHNTRTKIITRKSKSRP
ncbi:hypothetical protein L1887_41878 [Cichorium endivia]|nr:hypothetical protein L1887_41878 [Cichorium endivia]